MFRTLIAAIAALLLLGAPRANAGLLFSLNPAGQQGSPGTTLVFNATLTNTGVDEVWLNGDGISLSSPLLSLDDTLFFANTPLSLAGAESWTGDIFTVKIDPGLPGALARYTAAGVNAAVVYADPRTFDTGLRSPNAATQRSFVDALLGTQTGVYLLARDEGNRLAPERLYGNSVFA